MKWNVRDYTKHASYVSQLGKDVLELCMPQEGETVLDLGCGDGELVEQLSL